MRNTVCLLQSSVLEQQEGCLPSAGVPKIYRFRFCFAVSEAASFGAGFLF